MWRDRHCIQVFSRQRALLHRLAEKGSNSVEGGTDVAAVVIGRNRHAVAGNPCQTCITPLDQVAAPDIEVAGGRRSDPRPLPLEMEAGVRVAQKPLASGDPPWWN